MNFMFRCWPPQYWWALKGTGGGGGERTVVVRDTEGETTSITTASSTWTHTNSTGYPLFVQVYDDTGDEMRTDITGRD